VDKNANQKQKSAQRRARNRARGQKRTHARVRARPIYTHRTYKVTRRCIERRFLFTPDANAEQINEFVGYCLAYAANQCGVQIHACVFMSNHHHTDLTDPLGNLAVFKQLFHSLLARGINTMRGRFDAVWSPEKASDTRRPTDDETLGDLVYTLTNPVKSGLVKWGNQWLGFTTYGWQFGESRTFKRPDWFFDKQGNMPQTATLTLVRPPIFSRVSDDQVYDILLEAVRTQEEKFHDEFRRTGRRFMGREKLLRQRWNRSPQSFEERFTVAPRVASSSYWLKLAELNRDRAWERAYAAARAELLAGRDAVFPPGTYWMRRFAGVTVGQQLVS
jgi:REP element-mobilizing transposase RayT